ncbi:MAG: hypothetical protein ACPHL6_09920 [Rubripirellula sp.]
MNDGFNALADLPATSPRDPPNGGTVSDHHTCKIMQIASLSLTALPHWYRVIGSPNLNRSGAVLNEVVMKIGQIALNEHHFPNSTLKNR